MRTCAQASSIRAMPENEIPPAMRVDIYFVFLSDFFHGAHRKRIAADSETHVEIGEFHAVHALSLIHISEPTRPY